jgi:DNA polymerase-3 subunit delta
LAAVADDLKPVYLLAGTDRPKIERAVQRLRSRFAADAFELQSADVVTGEDVVASANAMGLFAAGGRLIVVEGVEAWKAPDAKAIAEYLASPAPDTVLALVGADVKRDSALAKACAKAGESLRWDVAKRDLSRWVAEQFKLHGVQVDTDACRALVDLVGEDLHELANEVDKLSTWAAGETITEREVETLVPPRAETSAFALTDAWGTRDVRRVLGACEALLERSGDPHSRTIPRVVGLLGGHVARVRACQALDAEGVRPKDAAARLKIHPFAAEKAFGHARNYGAEELRDVTLRLARLDVALKGGSRLAPELELQRALVDITRRAETPAGVAASSL